MEKSYNVWSLYLILVCLVLGAYSLYSNINNTWLIAPPNYILFIFSVLAFIFAIIGFKDKRNRRSKTRSWLTVILSASLSIAFLLATLFVLFVSGFGANKHLEKVQSPEGTNTIDFYRYDAGAMGSFGVRGELNGPLWFKKRIYYQDNIENVEVKWENENTVSINNHLLDLKKGERYGY